MPSNLNPQLLNLALQISQQRQGEARQQQRDAAAAKNRQQDTFLKAIAAGQNMTLDDVESLNDANVFDSGTVQGARIGAGIAERKRKEAAELKKTGEAQQSAGALITGGEGRPGPLPTNLAGDIGGNPALADAARGQIENVLNAFGPGAFQEKLNEITGQTEALKATRTEAKSVKKSDLDDRIDQKKRELGVVAEAPLSNEAVGQEKRTFITDSKRFQELQAQALIIFSPGFQRRMIAGDPEALDTVQTFMEKWRQEGAVLTEEFARQAEGMGLLRTLLNTARRTAKGGGKIDITQARNMVGLMADMYLNGSVIVQQRREEDILALAATGKLNKAGVIRVLGKGGRGLIVPTTITRAEKFQAETDPLNRPEESSVEGGGLGSAILNQFRGGQQQSATQSAPTPATRQPHPNPLVRPGDKFMGRVP